MLSPSSTNFLLVLFMAYLCRTLAFTSSNVASNMTTSSSRHEMEVTSFGPAAASTTDYTEGLGSGYSCPDFCNCYFNYEAELQIFCANRGLKDVPSSINPSAYFLYLENNKIGVLRNGFLRNLTSLEKLDLSYNPVALIEEDAFLGLESLLFLWMDGILQPNAALPKTLLHPLISLHLLGLQYCHLKEIPPDFFAKNKDIWCIVLSGNQLSNIPDGLFRGFEDMTELFLDNNYIKHLQKDMFKGNFLLERIELQNNSIQKVPQDVGLQDLTKLEVLNLSHNPLSCTCSLIWFSDLINSVTIVLGSSDDLICASPKSQRGVKVADFLSNVDCSRVNVKIGVSFAVVVVIGVLLGLIVYKYRWDMRFYWFLWRAKFRGWRKLQAGDIPINYDYDVFVSYNSHDKEWIVHQLLPTLEGVPFGLKICVDYRDFEFGQRITDNILNAIQRSRKTLLVLSQNFVDSEWCFFELEMAIWRLFAERQDVVVMVLLEPIPDHKIPLLLKRLMKRRVYAEWTEEPAGQRLFWEKLARALKSSNERREAFP